MKNIFVIAVLSAVLLTSCGVSGEKMNETSSVTTEYDLPDNSFSERVITEVKNSEEMETMETKSERFIFMIVGDSTIEAVPENNSSADALIEKLSEGDIIIDAREYGGFEKVGSLGFYLPRKDVQTSTSAGDIMLYQGNQLTIFYGENSWSYTKLAHVDMSAEKLEEILGTGDVRIRLSLNE